MLYEGIETHKNVIQCALVVSLAHSDDDEDDDDGEDEEKYERKIM